MFYFFTKPTSLDGPFLQESLCVLFDYSPKIFIIKQNKRTFFTLSEYLGQSSKTTHILEMLGIGMILRIQILQTIIRKLQETFLT